MNSSKKLSRKKIFIICAAVVCIIIMAFIFNEKKDTDDYTVVATVNGNPVVYREYKIWNDIKSAVKARIQLMLAEDEGLTSDTSYKSFLYNQKKENERRVAEKAAGEDIKGTIVLNERLEYIEFIKTISDRLKRKLAGEGTIKTEESDLQEKYRQMREQFEKPDNIKINKIEISWNINSGDENEIAGQEGRRLIEEAQRRLEEGEDFKKVAGLYNEKVKIEQVFDGKQPIGLSGGFLFEEAAKLKEGETSGILEDKFCYYIIKCIEKKDMGYMTFEEVSEYVKKICIDEEYDRYIDEKIREADVDVNFEVLNNIK